MTPLPTALHTLLAACDARSGLLDLRVPTDLGEQRYTTTRGLTPASEARARELFSSTILAEALASGRVVRTASAVSDPRFSDRHSVRDGRIRAVLCAPLGNGDRVGVVYLERDAPFGDADEAYVRGWCEGIAPLLKRHVLPTLSPPGEDPTGPARAVLRCEELIGRSEALARTLDQVLLARLSRAPVLITGPTGAGKSTIARVLHRSSRRAGGPFAMANAANLSGELTSAELFGVTAGAATGVKARRGLLAEADGGTLFLDEVGLLPLETQGRLLTFLDTGEYRPVGRDRALTADVRLITATNEDLATRVRDGSFREDLLFRLNVLPVETPPLRDRPADVPLLAAALVTRVAELDGLAPLPVSAAAMTWLQAQPWPGQVRQLRNVMHRGLLRAHAEQGTRIDPEHLGAPSPIASPGPGSLESPDLDLRKATAAFQRQFLADALARFEGNRTATARAVGLSRSRLYELMDELGLK